MRILFPTVLALSLLAVGCSSSKDESPSPDTGSLAVQATDAFLSHTQVEEARIDLRAIRVNSGAGLETIYDGEVIEVVLTDLTGGKVSDLATAPLADGIYHEVELEITGGYLRLVNGKEFSPEQGTLTLCATSGMTTISPVITISGSPGSTMLLDFDLTQSFAPMPPGSGMLAATSFELCPKVRAVELEATGELRGTINTVVGDKFELVEKANVVIMPAGEIPENAITTTGSSEGGVFAAIGLEPGQYDILVETKDLRGYVKGLSVVVGQATTADITIQ